MTNDNKGHKNKVASLFPNQNKQGVSNKKKHRHNRLHNTVVNIIIAIFVIGGVGCIFQILKTNNSINHVESEVVSAQDTLKSEQQAVTALQNQANLLKNDEYVAKLARSRYYLSNDGEIIFSIPEDNDSKQAEILNQIYLEQQSENQSDHSS